MSAGWIVHFIIEYPPLFYKGKIPFNYSTEADNKGDRKIYPILFLKCRLFLFLQLFDHDSQSLGQHNGLFQVHDHFPQFVFCVRNHNA